MTAAAPRIVASVGTDHHPFTRLVTWVEQIAVDLDVSCFVQHGTAAAPVHVDGAPLIPHPDLLALFATADVVVTHGGPATIMDARQSNRRPLVVPRDPALGEHVDDHQQLFAARLELDDVVLVTPDEVTLRQAIIAGLADPASLRTDVDPTEVPAAVGQIAALVEQLERSSRRWPRRRPGRVSTTMSVEAGARPEHASGS